MVRIPPNTLWLLAAAAWSPLAAAQAGQVDHPGSLDKAFEALVGDGTGLQVIEERVEAPRPADPIVAERPPADTWLYAARPFVEQLGRVDLGDPGPGGVGTVDVRRAGLAFSASRFSRSGRGVVLEFEFESGSYGFDNVTGLVPAAAVPVENVLQASVGTKWVGPRDRTWAWAGGVGVIAAAEQDAALEDSLSTGAFVQTRYRIDRDLGVVFGLFGRTELEDDPLLIPVVGFDWRIDDDTRLETVGPSLRLTHDLDSGRSLFAKVAYSNRQYRLDGLGPLPGGSFTDRDISVVGGFDWHPGLEEWGPLSASSARIYAGTTLWREFEFRAADEPVSEADADAAWILGASVTLRF